MEKQIYFALREEIMHNFEQENSLIQFVYTVVVAALGLALTIKSCWIALIVSFAVFPMSLRVADIRYSTAYIATYLKTFLEDDNSKWNWEKIHFDFAVKYSGKSLNSFIYNASRLDFAMLTLISVILFWFIHGMSWVNDSLVLTVIIIAVQVFIVGFETFLGFRYANLKKLKESLCKKWEELYDETIQSNEKL